MKMDFFMPTMLISGRNCVINNSSMLCGLGRKCLIITGGSSAKKSGALDDLVCALEKEGTAHDVFTSIEPNPLISSCHSAGVMARETGADFIAGIGGGSVLDASKAIAIYAANGDLKDEDIYKREYTKSPLPVVLIGTTSGTGSEVTGVSVLTRDDNGRKKSISGADCYARLSFLDAKYTHSLPFDATASTALDALAHTVEGWFGPRMNETAKLFAVKAMHLLWGNIKFLGKEKCLPDEKQREELYFGSIYAGLVINSCGTGFPHPLGYVLTEGFNVPHGKACAAFMPKFLERAEKFEPEKLNELLETVSETRESFSAAVSLLEDLHGIKISRQEAFEYAKRWDKIPKNFEASPGGLTQQEAAEILAEVF